MGNREDFYHSIDWKEFVSSSNEIEDNHITVKVS